MASQMAEVCGVLEDTLLKWQEPPQVLRRHVKEILVNTRHSKDKLSGWLNRVAAEARHNTGAMTRLWAAGKWKRIMRPI